MKKKEIDHIEELIRKANSQNRPELYRSAYEYLESLNSEHEDYLLYYYKGLTCYSNPDTEEFNVDWAIKHFKKALELSPKNLMSRVYLAYSYYDVGKYIKTSEVLLDIFSDQSNIEAFIKGKQIWRIVNLTELLTVTCLKLKRIDRFLPYYFAWNKMYDDHIRNTDFYFPESLVIETAQFLKNKGKSLNVNKLSSFTLISSELINKIEENKEFEKIYSTELKILKDWNGHEQHNPLHIPVNLDA